MSELKTLRNGLALLRLLEGRPASALTDLAREMRISPSTAHRIASTLTSEGFLQQDPRSRRYMLSEGIVLGAVMSEVDRCLAVAPAHLVSLRDSTGETVHIGLRTGLRVSFPLAFESTRQVRVSSSAGRTVPLYAAATGKILLSYMSDGDIRSMFGDQLEPLTDQTLRTTDALLLELADVRKKGYAINVSETEVGLYTVAVAVEGSRGGPVCALAISAPVPRVRSHPAKRNPAVEDRLLDALRLCSGELSAHLAQWSGPGKNLVSDSPALALARCARGSVGGQPCGDDPAEYRSLPERGAGHVGRAVETSDDLTRRPTAPG